MIAPIFNIPIPKEIKDVLWESITSSLGIDFRFEDQSAARPSATGVPEGQVYGTLKLITGPIAETSDEERFIEDGSDLKVETVGPREFTLSINIFRKGAGEYMSKLQKLFNSRNWKQKLSFLAKDNYGKELKVIEALASQDLTSLVQSDYEERFQMDVRLRTISSMIENIDPIDEVTVDTNVQNEAGVVVDDGKTTIQVP